MTEQDIFPGTSSMDNVYTKIWEIYKSEWINFLTRAESGVFAGFISCYMSCRLCLGHTNILGLRTTLSVEVQTPFFTILHVST